MKCKKHRRFQALRKPRKTTKYPRGCPQCWKVWHDKNDAIDFMKPWKKVYEVMYEGKLYEMYACNYGKTYEMV